jgi:diketogulonate reductase-like aldo/keto reductase
MRSSIAAWMTLSWTMAAGAPPEIPDMSLVDGHRMPAFGVGVYMSQPGEETYNQVKWALELGYRMIDTAQMYGNEADVGRAIRDSGIPRSQIYVQSKLNTNNHGYQEAYDAIKSSVKKMGLDMLDCFLVHSPYGGKLVETWDALIQLKKEGVLRSIGVSNYGVRHIQALIDHGRPLPVMNQIEMHPLIYAERQQLVEFCNLKGIVVQAYGSIFFGQKEHLAHPTITSLVSKFPNKTPAQILLRWGLQKGFQLIPKSVKRHRLEENMGIFDFHLTEKEMQELEKMEGRLDAYWNPVEDAPVDPGDTVKYRAEKEL